MALFVPSKKSVGTPFTYVIFIFLKNIKINKWNMTIFYISFRAVIGPEGTRSIDSWSP